MSGREQFKSPQNLQYTFKDFFAEQKARNRSRADITPSLAVSESPLLAAVAQVKRRAPPASREQADTPSGLALPRSRSPNTRVSTADGLPSTTGKRPRAQPSLETSLSEGVAAGFAAMSPVQPCGSRGSEAQRGSEARALQQLSHSIPTAGNERGQSTRQQTPETLVGCSATKRPATMRPAIANNAAARPLAVQPAGENHRFYLNSRKSAPHGEFIDQIHAEWGKQFARLEKHHSYIQWLFPVYENAGVNRIAHPLTKREAKAMRRDPMIARRIISSYRMMLKFYGFTLIDETTGEVRRSAAWLPRFRNFNAHTHNNLRISRILVSLGELGFRRYKVPLLEALRIEIFENNQLPACRNSFINFWEGLVTDEGKPWYVRKTRETSDTDRAESIFFTREAGADDTRATCSTQDPAPLVVATTPDSATLVD